MSRWDLVTTVPPPLVSAISRIPDTMNQDGRNGPPILYLNRHQKPYDFAEGGDGTFEP
jgi:hypothetical protein